MSRSTDLKVGSQTRIGYGKVEQGPVLCHSLGSLNQMSPLQSQLKTRPWIFFFFQGHFQNIQKNVLTRRLEEAGGEGTAAPFLVSLARLSSLSFLVFKAEPMGLAASRGCPVQSAPQLPFTGLLQRKPSALGS